MMEMVLIFILAFLWGFMGAGQVRLIAKEKGFTLLFLWSFVGTVLGMTAIRKVVLTGFFSILVYSFGLSLGVVLGKMVFLKFKQ
jgi:uncharacterized membrane protein YbjE (DUF340 family)